MEGLKIVESNCFITASIDPELMGSSTLTYYALLLNRKLSVSEMKDIEDLTGNILAIFGTSTALKVSGLGYEYKASVPIGFQNLYGAEDLKSISPMYYLYNNTLSKPIAIGVAVIMESNTQKG